MTRCPSFQVDVPTTKFLENQQPARSPARVSLPLLIVTMSNRVQKRKRTSTDRRRDQAYYLENFGSSTMPDCSFCKANKLECLASDSSNRCLPCVQFNRPRCDVHGVDCTVSPPSACPIGVDARLVRGFVERKKRLDKEKQETLSKLLRLERQSRALEEEAARAYRRESELLAEEEENTAASLAPAATSSGSPVLLSEGSADLFAGFDWLQGPLPEVDPDFVGGILAASQGSGDS